MYDLESEWPAHNQGKTLAREKNPITKDTDICTRIATSMAIYTKLWIQINS